MNTMWRNLSILYFDELRGFGRSRVMLVLWIGLPLVTMLFRLLQPNMEGISLTTFTALMTGSIGGTLSAVLMATTVTGERLNKVFDLFLVRPIRRGWLLVAKYLAALTCLFVAAFLAVAVGLVADAVNGLPALSLIEAALVPLLLSLSAMAIATAVGLLFGVLFNSVAAAAILSVYLGNQLSGIVLLPMVFLSGAWPLVIAIGTGLLIPVGLLLLSAAIFRRKTL
jgi:ABC-2 type transport system permease protein